MNYIKQLQEKIKNQESEIAVLKHKEDIKSSEFNPEKNPNAISIIKQADGNYLGYIQKFGKVVRARQNTPETVLQLLLAHDGSDEEKVSA